MLTRLSLRGRGEKGIVGFNLVLTIGFALYAVTQFSRVVLAASGIDDRVKVIVTEVGPGSNVSRLDETQKLNETGRLAEGILAASQNLSARAGTIVETAQSIDATASRIDSNVGDINQSVRSIDATTKALVPVVRNIDGDGTFSATAGGVGAIDMRAQAALQVVGGIQTDLSRAHILGTLVSVDRHAVAICNGEVLALVGGGTRCTPAVAASAP
jgi:hypothetical protein